MWYEQCVVGKSLITFPRALPWVLLRCILGASAPLAPLSTTEYQYCNHIHASGPDERKQGHRNGVNSRWTGTKGNPTKVLYLRPSVIYGGKSTARVADMAMTQPIVATCFFQPERRCEASDPPPIRRVICTRSFDSPPTFTVKLNNQGIQ